MTRDDLIALVLQASTELSKEEAEDIISELVIAGVLSVKEGV